MRRHLVFALTVALAAAASVAQAQRNDSPGWEFALTPYGWFAGMSGNIRTPLERLPERSFSADFSTIVGDLSTVPIMGMAELRHGRFGLLGDLLYLGLEQDIETRNVAFLGGRARVNSTIGNILGLYRVVDLPGQSVDIGAGVRIWNSDTKLSLNSGLLPGVIKKSSVSWADPLLAARYHRTLSERFGLTVYGDIGGFDLGSILTWQVSGMVDYRATESITLSAGWRYLTFNKKQDDFRLDLGFNGPFIAATFRF